MWPYWYLVSITRLSLLGGDIHEFVSNLLKLMWPLDRGLGTEVSRTGEGCVCAQWRGWHPNHPNPNSWKKASFKLALLRH